jgi:GNAT superfamily N-acetyltransferase
MSGEGFQEKFRSAGGKIREIARENPAEVQLVATRMRQTLIDVLGEEKGGCLYTMDWLVERVLWHLNPECATAKVFLAENREAHITGQAIARIERENERPYGYFSTLYVEPESRRLGVATNLMLRVEDWFREMAMPRIVYNTAETNAKLIGLFEAHGFRITLRESEMVQLTKLLVPDGEPA